MSILAVMVFQSAPLREGRHYEDNGTRQAFTVSIRAPA